MEHTWDGRKNDKIGAKTDGSNYGETIFDVDPSVKHGR